MEKERGITITKTINEKKYTHKPYNHKPLSKS